MALVLTVDDEGHVRRLLGHLIRGGGHEVAEAGNADEALAFMEQRAADVAFLDIQMPGHDGRWLAVELRKRYPHTAIVLATSVTDLEPTLTLRFGVISYLTKPFNAESVSKTLEMAVAWHHEAKTAGPHAVEQVRLEEWLDSLEIL